MVEGYSNRMIGGGGAIRDQYIIGEQNIAREVGFSVDTIRRWKKNTDFPVKKIEGSCVISREKLNNWVMNQL